MNTASLELAMLFPMQMAYQGADTTLADLARLFTGKTYAGPYDTSKSQAVHLVILRNLSLDCTPLGQGNRAKRRQEAITYLMPCGPMSVAKWNGPEVTGIYDQETHVFTELSPDDINRMATIDDELRTEGHHYPDPVNIHD